MSTAQSASVSTLANLNKAASEATAKYGLNFNQGKINTHEIKMPLQYGEIQFPGLSDHRARYIIAPKEEESADSILRWMFTDTNGWKMKPPNLVLSMFGGRDHYVNWANSDTLKNKEAWDVREDYRFQDKFKSRLEEIAGGVCQAVTECGGWFDFGTGSRGGMNEVIKDGLKTYWSAFGLLSGLKEKSVVLAIRKLDDTDGKEQFLENSRKVCTPDPTTGEMTGGPETLTTRVMYPGNVDVNLFPELSGGTPQFLDPGQTGGSSGGGSQQDMVNKKEVYFRCCMRFLSNSLTHVIFVQNDQIMDRLRANIKKLATRAVILANGPEKLITPGVDGKILLEAMSGTPVVVLHNTGGAAEMLGASVLKRRQPHLIVHDYGGFRMPENVPTDQFLILNPAKDSVEKVINKLTLVLSTVQDAEMMEVGYSKAEETRILYAWELYALFKFNVNVFRRRARAFFYVGMIFQMVLTWLTIATTDTDTPFDAELEKCRAKAVEKKIQAGAMKLDQRRLQQTTPTTAIPGTTRATTWLKTTVSPAAAVATTLTTTARHIPLVTTPLLTTSASHVLNAVAHVSTTLSLRHVGVETTSIDFHANHTDTMATANHTGTMAAAASSSSESGGFMDHFASFLGIFSYNTFDYVMEDYKDVFELSLYVIPIFVGFLLTLNSRLNPIGKWTGLESGAVRIHSEIYQYRCRVGQYMPMKSGNSDIRELVEELCDNPDPHLAQLIAEAKRRRKKADSTTEGPSNKEVSRRILFSEELDGINSDVVGDVMQNDVLSPPSKPLAATMTKVLFTSTSVQDKESNLSVFEKMCKFATGCCTRRNLVKGEGYDAINPAASSEDATNHLWAKAGGDFSDNPNLLEDDFLSDDGISVITADDYVFFRFLPLMQYHTRVSRFLTSRVQLLQTCQFLLTATLAGAKPLKFQRWVPFFVAAITAVTGTLEFENYPARLRNVNQSLECLKNLRIWWQSLSMVERRLPKNKELLVLGAEATADSEISAWKKSLKTSVRKDAGGGGGGDHSQEEGDKKA